MPPRRPIAVRVAAVVDAVRLAAALVLLAAATLTFLPAPTSRAWLLAIVVGEYGHYIAPVALLWLWPGWRRTWMRQLAVACALAAAVAFVSPAFRALLMAQTLDEDLTAAFGPPAADLRTDAPRRVRPLDPARLFVDVPAGDVTMQTVGYVTRNGRALEMDVYTAAQAQGARPRPIVVVVHGGGWSVGDRTDLAALNVHLAHLGYVVAVPSYRLVPEDPFPAAYDDVRTAVAVVRGRAREWNGDAERIAMIGRSAGAQLALLTAYRHEDDAIRGVVGFYGPADLRYAWEHPGNPWVYDGIGTVERYLGGPPSVAGARYEEASPYQFVGPTTPPTLLIHGRLDEVVSVVQSERLAARLGERGRRHLLIAPGWATHGCDYNFSGPSGQLSTYAIERFLAAVL